MDFIPELKDYLLYEIQDEFFNERGMGAKYRLTLAGTRLFAKYLKDPSDTQEIVRFFQEQGICDEVEYTEDDFSIRLKIKNCAFCPLRDMFMDNGRQPLCCPPMNALMKAVELQTGLSPEMLPVERDGCVCKVGMAKMGNENVVDVQGVF